MLYVLKGLLFAALAVVAVHFSLAAAVALAALDGVVAITAKALTRAATATALTPRGMLRSGNALLNMGFAGLGAIGPVIAGAIVALASPAAALAVDAVTFAGVAVILTGLPVDPPAEDAPAPWRERLREGLTVVARRGPVRVLLLGQAAALLCFCAIVPIEVVYAVHSLHAGDAGYGALLTAWGLGMAIGGLGFASAGRLTLPLLTGLGTAGIGVAYLGMAVAPSLAVACGAAAIGGIEQRDPGRRRRHPAPGAGAPADAGPGHGRVGVDERARPRHRLRPRRRGHRALLPAGHFRRRRYRDRARHRSGDGRLRAPAARVGAVRARGHAAHGREDARDRAGVGGPRRAGRGAVQALRALSTSAHAARVFGRVCR